MKKYLKKVLIVSIFVVMFSSIIYAKFVADITYAPKYGTAFEPQYTPGISAYNFITQLTGTIKGKINGLDAVQLTCDGATVTFNTSQATNLSITCDQELYDYDRNYWLEVYVNGVHQYDINDFDNPKYNKYSYTIFGDQHSNIMFKLKSQLINPGAYSSFVPVYITNAVLK